MTVMHDQDLWIHGQGPLDAWSVLHGQAVEHVEVELMEPKRLPSENRKSYVFRLSGVGDGGSDVVAKLSAKPVASVEAVVYADVLGTLHDLGLRFYGLAAHPQVDMTWIFVEYADGESYQVANEEHVSIAVSWLGNFHRRSAQLGAVGLPDHGAAHYLELLWESWQNMDDAAPSRRDAESRATIARVKATIETLMDDWLAIAEMCAAMPQAVVHGDFCRKHIKIRSHGHHPIAAVFDWEHAGWGPIAPDLGSIRMHLGGHRLEAYRSAVSSVWPSVQAQNLSEIAHLGWVLRRIAAISWESQSVPFPRAHQAFRRLEIFNEELGAAIRTPVWR